MKTLDDVMMETMTRMKQESAALKITGEETAEQLLLSPLLDRLHRKYVRMRRSF